MDPQSTPPLTANSAAARRASRIHDLRRLHIPFTRIMLFPINVGVIDAQLLEIASVFREHNVTFWLRDGTALGVYRDGTVLPHDDDADLGIWHEDIPAIMPAFHELVRRGYVLYKQTPTVFAFLKDNETVEFCVSGFSDAPEPYLVRLEAYFKSLKPILYRGVEFNLPANIEEYLEFSYGTDWRTPKVGAWLNTYWRGIKKRTKYAENFGR